MYKEKMIALVKAVKEDEEVLSLIEDQLNNLGNYVNTVYAMEVQLPILRFRLEGAEYREAMMALDRGRKVAHDAAIAGCSILNRIAAMFEAPPMYSGDLKDRHAIGDFCIAVVDELFQGRTRCPFQELLNHA